MSNSFRRLATSSKDVVTTTVNSTADVIDLGLGMTTVGIKDSVAIAKGLGGVYTGTKDAAVEVFGLEGKSVASVTKSSLVTVAGWVAIGTTIVVDSFMEEEKEKEVVTS